MPLFAVDRGVRGALLSALGLSAASAARRLRRRLALRLRRRRLWRRLLDLWLLRRRLGDAPRRELSGSRRRCGLLRLRLGRRSLWNTAKFSARTRLSLGGWLHRRRLLRGWR